MTMRYGWHVAATMVTVVATMALGGCGSPQVDDEPLSSPTYERALAYLQTQAHAGDPKVRANCIEALQVGHDPRGLDTIEEGLQDKDAGVRFVSAMAAGQRKAQVLRTRLNTLVTSDPDESVRVGCAYALRRLGDLTHWGELGVAMESKDWVVRANAALVVGMAGDEADQTLLEHYRRDTDLRVRFEITAALARLGDKDAQQVIVSESVNKYAEDQYHAMEVCAYLPEDVGLSPLRKGMEGATASATSPAAGVSLDLTTRRQLIAARSLAKMRNGEGSQVALENLKNPSPELRALAALAVGEMIKSWQAPGLEPLLADPDDGVKRAAAAAILSVYARAGKK